MKIGYDLGFGWPWMSVTLADLGTAALGKYRCK